ncbi:MAG: hypothetical protein ACD_22C00062G0008 [uncultured bacterium]|nr:MAG: hypothetical protein ACD_22C00062G0008 [uncultured bacterium]
MGKRTFFFGITLLISIFYLIWWVLLFFLVPTHDSSLNNYFADSYGVIAGLGGLAGLVISLKWGFLKSYVGRSISFLSLGLLSQFLGQLSYSVLFYVYGLENAYPSFGEIFYLSSIPLYIAGIWNIANASGFKVSLNSYKNKFLAIIVPFVLLIASYFLFLRGSDLTGLPFIEIVLVYFYPIGQALFVSLAMLTYYLTKDVLGGVMRKRVVFILFALLFQYFADSLFLHENNTGIWYAGGLSDLMFVVSYSLMAFGLLHFGSVEKDLKKV